MPHPFNISDSLLLDVLSLSKDATAIYSSADLHIRFANDAMLAMWGKDKTVIGQTFEDAVPEMKGQPFTQLLKNVWQTGQVYTAKDAPANVIIDNTLQTFYFDFEYKAIKNAEGDTFCLLHTATDVTERLKAQKIVAERERKEQELYEELAATNEELTAINEEYQATNEEVTALSEEYQTINEELNASNEEIKSAYDQLAELHAELERTEIQARLAKEAANLGMFDLDVVNDILLWDDKCKELFGIDIAKEVSYTQDFVNGLHPDDKDRIVAAVEVAFDRSVSNGLYDVEYRTVAVNDNRVRWVRAVGLVHFSEDAKPLRFIGTVMDITEAVTSRQLADTLNNVLLEANSNLQITEQGLRLAVDTAKLGIWSMDIESGIFDLDERCFQLFGLDTEAEIRMEDIRSIIDPDYQALVTQTVAGAMQGTPGVAEYYIINRATAKRSWIRGSAQYVPAMAGRKARLTGIITDLSAEKDDEQRKTDFIGIVSHELRTPLTSLSGYLQLLEMRAKKAEELVTLELVGKARKQGERMLKLINDFLDVARLGETRIRLNPTRFNLADLLRISETELAITLNGHILYYSPAPHIMVTADAEKIEQVLVNFVNNAVKYSPNGSTITVSSQATASSVKVSVKDGGIGIPKQDQPFLFERFYRVQSKHSETVKGFGIGLYICKEIIERHGGQIGVDSEPEQGSTFWFTLPLGV